MHLNLRPFSLEGKEKPRKRSTHRKVINLPSDFRLHPDPQQGKWDNTRQEAAEKANLNLEEIGNWSPVQKKRFSEIFRRLCEQKGVQAPT